MTKMICLGLLAVSFGANLTFAADRVAKKPKLVLAQPSTMVNFKRERASKDTQHVVNWVVDSDDNQGMPFVIVDKKNTKVFVFHADGQLLGAGPALLGLTRGDDSVPGIGERKLASILRTERITQAGRFIAALDFNLQGAEILWVDYDSGISLHPVITSNTKERRAQRLASPTSSDNRISYGCINVAAQLFDLVIKPAFTDTNGIVYILPETRSMKSTFASYDIKKRAPLRIASKKVYKPRR